MSDILFSSEPAEKLNKLVQDKIAPQLFLFCNYAPREMRGVGDDARYLPAIFNLYNLVIDCSCIFSRLGRENVLGHKVYLDYRIFNNYNNGLRKAEVLRSAFGHNNSEKNGVIEAERRKEYEDWVFGILQKKEPDCIEDYKILFGKVKTIADELYEAAEAYINAIAVHPAKEEIVKNWQKLILDWYCKRGVKQDIFFGQLRAAYRTYLGDQNMRGKELQINSALWVKRYYTDFCPFQKVVDAVTADVSRYFSAQGGTHMPTKDFEDLVVCVKTEAKEIGKETEKQYGRDPHCYPERLMAELRPMLEEAVNVSQCTLLPEDLLQEVIKRKLGNVLNDDVFRNYKNKMGIVGKSYDQISVP